MPRKTADVSYSVGASTVTVPIRASAYGQTQTFHATLPLEDVAGKSVEEIERLAFEQQEQAIETTLVQWDFAQRRGEPAGLNGMGGGGANWKKFSPPASS